MRNTSDQENILYNLIKNSSLNASLNGGIYKGERPNNSKKEDTVISAMLTSDGTLQQGVSNVNIYIPKIEVKIDGVNQLLKDTKRIGEVLAVAQPVLKGKIGNYYSLWTSKQSDYDEPEINQTRLSFRIEFRFDDTIIS